MDSTLANLNKCLDALVDPVSRLNLIDSVLRPPEPQLLDTCTVQHLDWVDRQIDTHGPSVWDADNEKCLQDRYGVDTANDLLDLGTLYKRFEHEGGYPWLVSDAAINEANLLFGSKGVRLEELITFFAEHQSDWGLDTYPGLASGLLLNGKMKCVSKLALRGLGILSVEECYEHDGPLGFLPDKGDRVVAAHALLANIPAVLTTDRRTFWRWRTKLEDLGLKVFRPSELLDLYETYWGVLQTEFSRRCKLDPSV